MCELTKNLPIKEVVEFSEFRGEDLTREKGGREKFRRVETPVGAMRWDI